jgi:hypothetical protein
MSDRGVHRDFHSFPSFAANNVLIETIGAYPSLSVYGRNGGI